MVKLNQRKLRIKLFGTGPRWLWAYRVEDPQQNDLYDAQTQTSKRNRLAHWP